MSDTIKFMGEFRKRIDTFMGAVVEMEKYENAKKEEKNEIILKAFDIMIERKLEDARNAWIVVKEVQEKFMDKYNPKVEVDG
jgi:hypothetical protein